MSGAERYAKVYNIDYSRRDRCCRSSGGPGRSFRRMAGEIPGRVQAVVRGQHATPAQAGKYQEQHQGTCHGRGRVHDDEMIIQCLLNGSASVARDSRGMPGENGTRGRHLRGRPPRPGNRGEERQAGPRERLPACRWRGNRTSGRAGRGADPAHRTVSSRDPSQCLHTSPDSMKSMDAGMGILVVLVLASGGYQCGLRSAGHPFRGDPGCGTVDPVRHSCRYPGGPVARRSSSHPGYREPWLHRRTTARCRGPSRDRSQPWSGRFLGRRCAGQSLDTEPGLHEKLLPLHGPRLRHEGASSRKWCRTRGTGSGNRYRHWWHSRRTG